LVRKELKGVWELMGEKWQAGKVCEPELKQQAGKLEPKTGKVRKHG
jgi:hypothetical protein